jgi:hypothetical protein
VDYFEIYLSVLEPQQALQFVVAKLSVHLPLLLISVSVQQDFE